MRGKFEAAYADGTIENLVDRVDDVYADRSRADHMEFWRGAAAFVRKPDGAWMSFYQPMHKVIRNLAAVMENAVLRNEAEFAPIARDVFTMLRAADENVLTAVWLRSHLFCYGLFGKARQYNNIRTFLEDQETERGIRAMSSVLRERHLKGELLAWRWDLQPVYTMVDGGAWDLSCQRAMEDALVDPKALDGLTLMLFGGGFSVDRAMMQRMCSIDGYLDLVRARLGVMGAERPHASVVAASRRRLGSVGRAARRSVSGAARDGQDLAGRNGDPLQPVRAAVLQLLPVARV